MMDLEKVFTFISVKDSLSLEFKFKERRTT
jgi:hypothetical protein